MNRTNAPAGSLTRMVRCFRDGIGIRCWHRFGKPHGTAIRWLKCKPGLVGLQLRDGSLYIGAWWTIRLELVAVHITRFAPNFREGEMLERYHVADLCKRTLAKMEEPKKQQS